MSITARTKTDAEEALHDYYFRRWGLGIATLIITFLVIGIAFYIKRIERG